MLLEQGILTRLKEFLDKENARNSEENTHLKTQMNNPSNKSISELSLLCICAMMRSPSILQRKIALRAHSMSPVASDITFQSLYSPYMYLLRYFQLLFSSNLQQHHETEPLKGSFHGNETIVELLNTFLCVFEVDVKFVHAALAFGIIGSLQLAVHRRNYEVKTEAGYCLCALAMNDDLNLDTSTYNELLQPIQRLLTTTDLLLLDILLQSIERILFRFLSLSIAMNYQLPNEQQCHELKDSLDLLTVHPLETISHTALRVQGVVDRLLVDET
mmetsp:Transcript_11059/g.16631  ORF Transcript_11059/g.16631 Transcript_11059/m.16631 type:complete len:273 (-) Transcript_11059:1638-2456(-)